MVRVGDEAGHHPQQREGVDLEVRVVEGEVRVREGHQAVILLVHVHVLHHSLLDQVWDRSIDQSNHDDKQQTG